MKRSQLKSTLLASLAITIAVATLTTAKAMSRKYAAEQQAQGRTPQGRDQKPVASVDQVWVGKSDEGKSCETTPGIELDLMAQELKKAGIQVFAQQKVHDNKMRIQMCGTDTGRMNGFLILKKDLAKLPKGFVPITPP